MKFGICCGPKSLPVENDLQGSVARLSDAMQAAGADYLEWSVAPIAEMEQSEFEQLVAALASHPLRAEAFNVFVPAQHRITGPDVELSSLLGYCRNALGRVKLLGADVVVLGSGGARKVPEGFDPAQASSQFVQFCRELGPIAQDAGVTIALEPLNYREDNLLNTVAQGCAIVDEVAHPNIQVLSDLYHVMENDEPLNETGLAGPRLRHTHVADVGRVAPGFGEGGEAPFVEFFQEMRRAGYDQNPNARCSVEGKFSNLEEQLQPTIAHLRKRWEESANV